MTYERAKVEAARRNERDKDLPRGVFWAASHKPGSPDWTVKLADARK